MRNYLQILVLPTFSRGPLPQPHKGMLNVLPGGYSICLSSCFPTKGERVIYELVTYSVICLFEVNCNTVDFLFSLR